MYECIFPDLEEIKKMAITTDIVRMKKNKLKISCINSNPYNMKQVIQCKRKKFGLVVEEKMLSVNERIKQFNRLEAEKNSPKVYLERKRTVLGKYVVYEPDNNAGRVLDDNCECSFCLKDLYYHFCKNFNKHYDNCSNVGSIMFCNCYIIKLNKQRALEQRIMDKVIEESKADNVDETIEIETAEQDMYIKDTIRNDMEKDEQKLSKNVHFDVLENKLIDQTKSEEYGCFLRLKLANDCVDEVCAECNKIKEDHGKEEYNICGKCLEPIIISGDKSVCFCDNTFVKHNTSASESMTIFLDDLKNKLSMRNDENVNNHEDDIKKTDNEDITNSDAIDNDDKYDQDGASSDAENQSHTDEYYDCRDDSRNDLPSDDAGEPSLVSQIEISTINGVIAEKTPENDNDIAKKTSENGNMCEIKEQVVGTDSKDNTSTETSEILSNTFESDDMIAVDTDNTAKRAVDDAAGKLADSPIEEKTDPDEPSSERCVNENMSSSLKIDKSLSTAYVSSCSLTNCLCGNPEYVRYRNLNYEEQYWLAVYCVRKMLGILSFKKQRMLTNLKKIETFLLGEKFSYFSKEKVNPFIFDVIKYFRVHGIRVQGLFRLPGKLSIYSKMLEELREGKKIALEEYNIRDVASFFKAYIREELNGIIIPSIINTVYECFAVESSKVKDEISQYIPFVFLGDRRKLLLEILSLYHLLAKNREVTNMNINNLAICSAPSFFPKQVITDYQVVVKQIQVIENLFNLDFEHVPISLIEKSKGFSRTVEITDSDEYDYGFSVLNAQDTEIAS